MHKTKLLFVTSVFVERGAEILIINLFKSLPKDMYDIKIACLRNHAPFAHYLNENTDIRVDIIGMKHNLDLYALYKFYRYVRQFNPHIINFHSYRAAFWGRPISKLLNIPVILYSVHNKWGGKFRFFLDRRMSKFTDAIIPYSLAVKRHLINDAHISEKYIVNPIYAGIDLKRFSNCSFEDLNLLRKELTINKDEKVIGFIGNLDDSHKGVSYLIESVKRLTELFPALRCLIIGDGPDKKYYEQLITRYNLNDNIVMLGQRKDVHLLLHLMEVFVLPSLWEGLPVVILEAMATSCPVIATNVDGIPEIITHKKNGLLVESKNIDSLTSAIKSLLSDSTLRDSLAVQGFETVKANFSVQKMAENYSQLFQTYYKKHS